MTNPRPTPVRSKAANRINPVPGNSRNGGQPAKSASLANAIQGKVDAFFKSFSDLLNDITALEVSTMVVSEITGHKFNPEDAYMALYAIPKDDIRDRYFDEHRIPIEIRPRFLELRKKLQDAYNEYVGGIQEGPDFPELPDPSDSLDERRLMRLLSDNQFLRNLRKLRELRHMLEGSQSSANNIVDIISAQTVIQLDGDILNRFDRRLLTDSNKDFLLQVHKQAVTSGEEQWRNLLRFMVELIEDVIIRRQPPTDNPMSLLPDGKTPDQ